MRSAAVTIGLLTLGAAGLGAQAKAWVEPKLPCDIKPGFFRLNSALVDLQHAAEQPQMRDHLLGQAQECLDKLRRLYSGITRSIQGYDFYPSQDEKSLEGPVKNVESQVSQIHLSLNDQSTRPDLPERGKLAGQESKSPDLGSDHA